MADRSISISLEAKVSGFVSGMKTAQKAADDFGSRTAAFARDNEQNLDRVGKAGMVFGGALLAGVTLAVKSFMEFDAAMSEVQSSTHETSANMDLLREAAIVAGADTSFSAKEAAKGIDELAKAGVSTKDILGGGLTGALSLAAAGSLEVGDAAEIAASALTQFKLSGDKVPHLADLLAAGAGKAQGSVKDLGMALNQTGLVAASTGLSIEETTGGLAAFASAGLIGSDAGTSMKTMLQRLTPQSKEAAAKMAELGISAYDSQGQFKGLAAFAENLKTSMADLTPEARNAAMGVIFGSDAVRAANVLYEQGATGIKDWTEKVNDAGYAAVTASIKQDNLAGDLEKLGGSFDSLLIKSGSGLSESLRGIVQGLEDMVDAVGKIPAPILNAGLGIAGIAGVTALAGGAVMTALPKFMEFKDSFDELSKKAPRAASGIEKVGKAAGVAAAAFVALQVVAAVFSEKNVKTAEDYGQAILKVAKATDAAGAGKGLDSIFTKFDKFANMPISNIDNMADAVKRLSNQTFNDSGNKFFEGFTNLLGLPKGEIGQLEDRLRGLGESMGDLAKNGAADTAAKSFQALTREFEKNGKGAKEALESVPGYKDALLGLATQAGVTLEGQDLLDFAMGKIPKSMQGASAAVQTYTDATGQSRPVTEDMAKELEKLGVAADGAVAKMSAFVDVLFRAGLLTLSERDAQRGYAEALAAVGLNADGTGAAIGEMGRNMDINTEQGRKNQSMLDAVAQAGISTTQAMANTTDAFGKNVYTQEQLQGQLNATFNNMVTAAGQFGITGDAAQNLARKVLGIPPGVKIESWMSDYAKVLAEQTTGALDKIDGRVVTATIIERNIRTIETQVKGGGYADDPSMTALTPGRAAGGAIYGSGPKGVDKDYYKLARGEHVLTDADVDAMGGQSAVYAFRKQLHSGQSNTGFQYAPAAAPSRQSVAAAEPGRPSGVSVGQISITQVDDPIGTAHAVTRRMSALAI